MKEMLSIAVYCLGGNTEIRGVEGERFGSWGAHQAYLPGDGFVVTHLRWGLAVPFNFPSMATAKAAAQEIHEARDDWETLSLKEIRDARNFIIEVAEKHGGIRNENGPIRPIKKTKPVSELREVNAL